MAVLKNMGISATLQKFWRFFWQLHHDDEDVEMMSLGRSILTARRPIRPAAARLSQPRRRRRAERRVVWWEPGGAVWAMLRQPGKRRGGVEATTKLIDSDISGCWLLWWTVRRSVFATAKIIYQPWHCNGQCWNKLRSRIFLRTRYRGSQCNTSQVMQKKIMAGKWRWPHWKTSEALEGPDKYVRRAKSIWRLHTLVRYTAVSGRPVYSYVKLCSQVGIQNWKICYVIGRLLGPILNWPDLTDYRSVGLP